MPVAAARLRSTRWPWRRGRRTRGCGPAGSRRRGPTAALAGPRRPEDACEPDRMRRSAWWASGLDPAPADHVDAAAERRCGGVRHAVRQAAGLGHRVGASVEGQQVARSHVPGGAARDVDDPAEGSHRRVTQRVGQPCDRPRRAVPAPREDAVACLRAVEATHDVGRTAHGGRRDVRQRRGQMPRQRGGGVVRAEAEDLVALHRCLRPRTRIRSGPASRRRRREGAREAGRAPSGRDPRMVTMSGREMSAAVRPPSSTVRVAPSPVTAASCTGALSWPTTTAPRFTGRTAGRGGAARGRTTAWLPPPREPSDRRHHRQCAKRADQGSPYPPPAHLAAPGGVCQLSAGIAARHVMAGPLGGPHTERPS